MSAADNPSSRKHYYKNKSNTSENLRKKRQESSVQLRKERRDDQVLKRRNINMEDLNTSPLKEMNCQDNSGNVMKFDDIVDGITDDKNPKKQFLCAQSARKILSRERHPPISKMVESNIVVKLVEFLQWEDNSNMQFEAAWALTNIASGNSEQTIAVVHAGAVPHLVNLLSNESENVVEQAMWALGNIAGDGASMRDYVLEKGVLKPLLALATPSSGTPQMSFLQNLSWTLSNLCRNKNPHTALQYVVQMLPVLVKLLCASDVQVKTDICWALSYITDGPNDRIELVLNSGVQVELTRLLGSTTDGTLLTPVLRVIGNIVTGTDLQTQRIIDLGTLNHFQNLLDHNRVNIQKEAAWTLSNITAGTQAQIQAVIDAGLVPPLVGLLNKGDYKTQKEACWAVTNFTSGASMEQLMHLANNSAIEGLCAMLLTKESRIIQLALEGISNMLMTAGKVGQLDAMCVAIEECGGVDAIETLQQHENESVYAMALNVIDCYFNDADDEVENVVPGTTENGNYFQFNAENQQLGEAPSGGFKF